MNQRFFLSAFVLGLALLSRPALAQVPRASAPATPATPATPAVPQTGSVSDASSRSLTLPAPSVPNHPGGYTDKHLDAMPNSLYPNGVPERNIDNGTRSNDQPRSGQAMPGSQPTKSIFKGRKRRDS